ncbi:MAG: FAD-binding oxidoreductase [Gammaproteobacteria bacterium]|nr:FAD-binding oxidoreductase [Gammaproteobacteria bacterium]
MTSAIQQLLANLPPAIQVTDPDVLATYLTDFRHKYTGCTAAVLKPRTTDEVVNIVRACNAHNVPLVPQGGNTGYCAGATPDDSGDQIVISLERLNQIRHFDPDNRSITVEAGMVLSDIQDHCENHGLLCPLALGSQQSCQIGGNISTNAGGVNVVRYGMSREMVLGLEVVLADGSVLDTLSPLRKDNTGYAVDQLFIGAEGSLGIITAATLKLQSLPKQRFTGFLAVASRQCLPKLLSDIQAETGDLVSSFEYMAADAIQHLLNKKPEHRLPVSSGHRHYVLIELGTSASKLPLTDLAEAALAEQIEANIVLDAAVASNEAQRAAFWAIRESIPEGEVLNGASVKHDVAVSVSNLPSFIDQAAGIVTSTGPGCRLSIYGHVGDGNVHFNVLCPEGSNEIDHTWIEVNLSPHIYELAAKMHGTFSAEHGIGQVKLALNAQYGNAKKQALMRDIKRALDPNNLMNPGKMLPLG